jgi:hypothetical protein
MSTCSNVHVLEGAHRFVEHLPDDGLFGQIATRDHRSWSLRLNKPRRFLGIAFGRGAVVMHHDVGTLAGECLSEGPAHVASAARDEGYFSGKRQESIHATPLPDERIVSADTLAGSCVVRLGQSAEWLDISPQFSPR